MLPQERTVRNVSLEEGAAEATWIKLELTAMPILHPSCAMWREGDTKAGPRKEGRDEGKMYLRSCCFSHCPTLDWSFGSGFVV